MVATRRAGIGADDNAPRRRGAFEGSSVGRRLLLRAALKTADEADEVPALLLREVLPRRHRALAIGHLAEQHTVGVALHLRRRPVRGLRGERGGGHAVALAAGAVTGDAVG